jgi:hypothetical protein
MPQEIQPRKIIAYKTSTDGCAVAALANLTASRDAGQAALFGASASQNNFRNLRALAQWTERSSVRRVDENFSSPADRLEYILRERTGQYLVVLQDGEGSRSHAVGIDCRARLVFRLHGGVCYKDMPSLFRSKRWFRWCMRGRR